VKAEPDAIATLINDVLYIDEVVEAFSIAGPWDIIIKIVSEKFENVAKVVTEKILQLKGIKETITLMAFQSGVIKSHRTEACEEASKLEQESNFKELYRLCRTCYNLKNCEFGSRVIVFGP
jgi:DNA-binding Lrp family transcriptional regulator